MHSTNFAMTLLLANRRLSGKIALHQVTKVGSFEVGTICTNYWLFNCNLTKLSMYLTKLSMCGGHNY